MQVVARVEVIDELSRGKLTTEYRYHHGYWDGAEREFRGFGRVDQRDTEVFEDYHAPGLHPERPFDPVPRAIVLATDGDADLVPSGADRGGIRRRGRGGLPTRVLAGRP